MGKARRRRKAARGETSGIGDIPIVGDEETRPPSAVPASPAGRTTITFYLPERLRNRARTAYRRTRAHETDHSWSDMLTKALLAEVERRERVHNDGERYVGTEERLRAGRPIGH